MMCILQIIFYKFFRTQDDSGGAKSSEGEAVWSKENKNYIDVR